MRQLAEFEEHIRSMVLAFRALPKRQTIRVVSHHDCDGICACAILVRALNQENIPYSLSIFPNLSESIIRGLAEESYATYVFADFGAGQMQDLNRHLHQKTVFILDHHPTKVKPHPSFHSLNPHDFGIDGSTEISGAGVAFHFATALNKRNEDMAHIAIIGALGDVQESQGFKELNERILRIAVEKKLIEVRKGLRFFGLQSRPIHKLLAYSSELIIPGVTGSESGAIQFLKSLKINPKKGSGWKLLDDLAEEEKKNLIAGIVLSRLEEKNPEDIFTNVYVLLKEDGPFSDAREFSTMLNACGRLNRASVGIGACLGDKKMKEKTLRCLAEYKRMIMEAINWIEKKKGEPEQKQVIAKETYLLINAEDKILSTMIGTIASILSKSNNYPPHYLFLAMAQSLDKTTKISLRISGKNTSINLKELVMEMTKGIGREAGGHFNAAGAVIPTEKEKLFISQALPILEMAGMEETV
ncbi:MAG: DHH family phosphoesterase [Nanoarchaeota archaeon]